MAGDSPSEALANYVRPLQRAVACVHPNARFATDCHNPRDGKVHNLILAGNEPIRVAAVSGRPSFLVFVHQAFVIVQEQEKARGPWRASTRAYTYAVMEDNDTQREIVAYHWHPGEQGFGEPHLHIPDHPNTYMEHAHIPSGRVSLEAFVWFLIREFKVKAHLSGYRGILEQSETQFRRFRSWG